MRACGGAWGAGGGAGRAGFRLDLLYGEPRGGEQLMHADDAVQVRAHHERHVTQPVRVRTWAVCVAHSKRGHSKRGHSKVTRVYPSPRPG